MTSSAHTTTKKELVNRIAERTGHTKVVVKEILQAFLDEIIHELAVGNRLEFREFGVFEVKERRARRAQNPRTLEKVDVPAKRVVKFKVGRLMRQRVCDEPAPTAPADRRAASRMEEGDARGDRGERGDRDERATPAARKPPPPTNNSPF